MTTIELTDDQAEALKAKAAAQGLTLEGWLQQLARPASRKSLYSLSELMSQCDSAAPLSDEDRTWLDEPATGREV